MTLAIPKQDRFNSNNGRSKTIPVFSFSDCHNNPLIPGIIFFIVILLKDFVSSINILPLVLDYSQLLKPKSRPL